MSAGNGDSAKVTGSGMSLIRIGDISRDTVAEDDDVFVVISPQNIVGGSIISYLEELVEAANGRPVILFNPKLGIVTMTSLV